MERVRWCGVFGARTEFWTPTSWGGRFCWSPIYGTLCNTRLGLSLHEQTRLQKMVSKNFEGVAERGWRSGMARVLCVTGHMACGKVRWCGVSGARTEFWTPTSWGGRFCWSPIYGTLCNRVWVFLCTNRRACRKWCWKKSRGKQGGRAFSLSVGASQVGQKSLPGFSVCSAFAGSSLA